LPITSVNVICRVLHPPRSGCHASVAAINPPPAGLMPVAAVAPAWQHSRGFRQELDRNLMDAYSVVDVFAVGFFILEWTVYAVTLEHTAYGRDSLSARMNAYREVWIRRLLDREARMVDMQIMASLQNGTAFFASTTLLAVGGSLALLRATNEVIPIIEKLPIGFRASPALWEIKCLGLLLIFVYAFFKFAWAYRLFNYVAILLGAMPPASQRDTPQAEAHVMRTTRLFQAAARHFNRGQRAFFFALGYLGWFVSPWALLVSTAAVVIVTWRRQFASSAWRAMGS
jgi:uncharacterized membrane protein